MRITLFRDMPSEGWLSMERYADELHSALIELGCEVRAWAPRGPWPHLRGRARVLANYAWRLLVYPATARSQQGDINHIIDHSYAHLLNSVDAGRTVVTCHDLAPLALGTADGSFSQRTWLRALAALPMAAHVLADSEFTRQALLHSTSLAPEQVTTVPLAVNGLFSQPADAAAVAALRSAHGLDDRPALLHVGSCEPRKNVEAILRALPNLLHHEPVLVQVGGRFSNRQRALIDSLGLRRSVIQVQASEPALRAWYTIAEMLVFPSFLEGFGLPVLEAMAAGTPVVCANTSSLPEVAGDAAELMDPSDPGSLARAVDKLLSDAACREALAMKGRARAQTFTWHRTAQATLKVYQTVHARRSR